MAIQPSAKSAAYIMLPGFNLDFLGKKAYEDLSVAAVHFLYHKFEFDLV
jgi:hypothetical protein